MREVKNHTVAVSLSQRQGERLRRLAGRLGTSQSGTMRLLLEEAAAAVLDGSRGRMLRELAECESAAPGRGGMT